MDRHKVLAKVQSSTGSISLTKLTRVLTELKIIEEVKAAGPTGSLHECFYWWVNGITEYPVKCIVCQGPITSFRNFKLNYSCFKTCSTRCAALDPARRQKTKSTLLTRYGAEHQMYIPQVKKKIETTLLKRYGVKNALSLEKTKANMKAKYGVDNISQSEHWKSKMREKQLVFTNGVNSIRAVNTLKKELGVDGDFSFQQLAAWKRDGLTIYQRFKNSGFELIKHSYADNLFYTRCVSCGAEQSSSIEKAFRCLNCHPIKYSLFECQVHDFLKLHGAKNIIRTDRKVVTPLELDLYLPDLGLAVECNGDYWHSFSSAETPAQKRKHLSKLEACTAKGIDLIQITEHEWNEKREIVQSLLLARLGKSKKVHARKLICKEISTKEAATFCNENHIQGSAPAKLALGLFDGDNLISCATVGPSRYRKSGWELIRFVTVLGVLVVGGFSKLITPIIQRLKEKGITEIHSYVDRRLFTGKSLRSAGWELSHASAPGYCWLINGERWSRNKTQKKRLEKLLPNFNPALTEAENMFSAGAARLWDCGQFLFTRKF